MILGLQLLVLILGLVLYRFSNPANGRAVETGRIMFFAGLLSFLIRFTPDMLPHLSIGGGR